MAKKHVFPVCSPNLLEFSPENAIKSLTIQAVGYRLFHTDGSWGQLLFNEANMEDWGVDGQTEGRGFFLFGWARPGTDEAQDFGDTSEPPPGLVICIGSKNKQNGTFDTFYTYSRFFAHPRLSYLFADDGLGSFDFQAIYDDQQSEEEYNAKPKFFSVMWTGTRWVVLGSNNWY